MKFKRELLIIILIIAIIFTIPSICAVNSEIQTTDSHNSTDTVSTVNEHDLETSDVDGISTAPDDNRIVTETEVNEKVAETDENEISTETEDNEILSDPGTLDELNELINGNSS